MEDIRSEKLRELMEIISERVTNPSVNPDFDGLFSILMKNKYISSDRSDWLPPSPKQTEEEKRRNAIGKFTNYAFYDLMRDDVSKINSNNFDVALKRRLNKEAFLIRKGLENNLEKIREGYGYAVSIGELGDTSRTDWYAAQKGIASKIMEHYGIVSTNL